MKLSRRALLGGAVSSTLPIVVPLPFASLAPPAVICAASTARAAVAAACDEAMSRNVWASGPLVALALPWVDEGTPRLILRVNELVPVFAWDVGAAARFDATTLSHALDSAGRTGARLLVVRDDLALVKHLETHTDIPVRAYSSTSPGIGAFEVPLSAELAQQLGRPADPLRLSTPRAPEFPGDTLAALFPAETTS